MRTKLLLPALLGIASISVAAPAIETVDATIPVEVLAVDPALASGGIPLQVTWSSPRIAMQPVRVARATVLEKDGEVLLLALLGPVERAPDGKARLDLPADRVAWCAPARFTAMTCYQDLDSDGKFETSRAGMYGTNEALALSRLHPPKTIEPLAYRVASEAELPRFQVGYRACGATRDQPHSFDGALRYETVVRRAEGMQWPRSGRCNNLAKLLQTRTDGAKVYEIGRFKVEVREKDEKELATTLLEGMPPGTLLAHVRTSWPLTDATERPRDLEEVSDASSFLVAVGSPTIATSARPGDQIFSLEVRHSLAGHLQVASEPRVRSDAAGVLPAGTPVYGIAMRSNLRPLHDAEVIWCTPVKQPKGLQPFCFANDSSVTSLVRVYGDPYSVQGLTVSGPGRNAPVVDRGIADFGAPLMLVIKVGKAEKKTIDWSWSLAPQGQSYAQERNLLRARDQSGMILLGTLMLKIKPAPDGQSFEIVSLGELAEGGPLELPVDAVRLVR